MQPDSSSPDSAVFPKGPKTNPLSAGLFFMLAAYSGYAGYSVYAIALWALGHVFSQMVLLRFGAQRYAVTVKLVAVLLMTSTIGTSVFFFLGRLAKWAS